MSETEPKSRLRNPIHSPFPASLGSECRKAAAIIDSLINPRIVGDGGIPGKILKSAKALVICTVLHAGFLGDGRFGSGLIVARLPDGSWSAPSAIGLMGLGGGGVIGFELIDFVFVLNDDKAVATFIDSATLTVSLNCTVAAGPGRTVEADAMIGTRGVATAYTYSKTHGLCIGVSAELGVLFEIPFTNKRIYERKLKAKQLLNGDVPPPREADPLMRILNSEKLRLKDPDESSRGLELEACALQPAELSERAMVHELPIPPAPQEMAGGDIQEAPSTSNQNSDRRG
ncbi:SH3 domain-containing protein [Penicillium capsulatum]|uniref:SH3 domain-containing protein n=1 Tax=Penicillium capsulatum TaxID=69766 RepID=A0A9W9HR23_9EURO|nr:SH3 domain-containing protein [Penicillium capsulatum]KAJ6106029.1 SH3 domain-containing protein [Penicillium capsulatum]